MPPSLPGALFVWPTPPQMEHEETRMLTRLNVDMNASPSVQSVGSTKPSTAASNASGKRARTIIVARDLRENATPAASATSSNSLQTLPRDEKTGRLSSYAALGNEEDVALYEQYLAEKYPLPVGGARHVATDRGAGDAVQPNATMPTTAQTDAKKRREAAVQHRKWLKSLPIHERLAYEREQNVLKKWKKINREWEEFKARTSKKLGKSERQLVMSRASEYREQIEMYDALQRAMPLSEKVAGDFWLVTLRNDGTRYVPVGNIFSGLYCPIRESSKIQPRVRRPLDYLRKEKDDDLDEEELAQVVTREKPLSSLERRSLEALARKKRRLKKQLEALFPHEVEPSQSGQLKVDTMDLFEWAAASRGNEDADELEEDNNRHTSSSRSLLLPLTEEINGDMMDSGRSSGRSRKSDRPTTSRTGPSFRLIMDVSGRVDTDTDKPRLEQQYGELSFFTDVDVMQQEVVYLENDGSAALHFQWRRVGVCDETITPRLTQNIPSPVREPERTAWTSISKMRDVIFPGECLEFVFTFQSKRAGVWLEEWHLDLDPPIPALVREHGHTAATVRLHCTAIDNFIPFTQRAQVAKCVEKAETHFMAEQVLKNDVIRRIKPTSPIEFSELSDAARSFYDTHRGGEFEDVQYSEHLISECHDLYAQARDLVVPSTTEGKEEESSSDEAIGTPRDTNSNATDTTAYPIKWELQLSSLKTLAIAADAKLSTEYASLKAQLAPSSPSQEEEEDDDDEEEDDLMERVLGTKARKREEEQASLRALEPHFVEDFHSLCLASYVSPYEPRLLTEALADNLADMASEASIVVDIARMQVDNHTDSREAACEMLQPLLVRALDESLKVDQQRERVFEHAKRKFQSTILEEKVRYTELPHVIAADAALVEVSQAPVVVFMQVDLDIANWYSLHQKSPDNPALEWQLSQKLLDHDTYIPPKVLTAVKSVRSVLNELTASGLVPTLVLLTELSSPPMTKALKKLEVAAAAQATTVANDMTPNPEEIETVRLKAARKRYLQLSLRGVEKLLQRAMTEGCKIEFLAALQALEDACRCPSRPQTADPSAAEEEPQAPSPEPRVILMEHLGALARQALRKQKPIADSTAPAPPGTPVAADKGKTDKKKPMVAPPAKGAVSVPPPADAFPPAEEEEDKVDIPPGLSLEMMAAQTLGRRLGKLSRYLVVDFIPTSWWECTLVYFAASPPLVETLMPDEVETLSCEDVAPPAKHILVGPQLSEKLMLWYQRLQLDFGASGAPAPIRAIVGGRGLEQKLRLLDGLLERADRIYVVGELAATIYRVLFTRSRIKEIKRDRKPVTQYEGRRFIAPVERLIQKAYRKQAELLLPFDLVVGDTHATFEWSNANIGEEEDEDDEDADEDEDEDEDEDDSPRKKRKTPRKQLKPLDEPLDFDSWQSRKQYEGEIAVVQFDTSHWIRFSDVNCNLIRHAKVVSGAARVLDASEGEEAPPTSNDFRPLQLVEVEWLARVFDVGPKSTKVLVGELTQADRGDYFWNGTLGVVECRDFETATKQLVESIAREPQIIADSIFVGGKSTSLWLRRFSQMTLKSHQSRSVIGRDAMNAMVLPLVIEGKQHAMITAFDCA